MEKRTKIIAEIGWNHMGDVNLAKEMISAAYENGASFAKFQTWSVSRLKSGPWDSDGRREIYNNAELSIEDHHDLKSYCDKVGIEFFSSVFSIPDSELLSSVQNDYVKIASFDSRNIDLLNHVNKSFNKIFISTGTSSLNEVRNIVNHIDENKLVLFHCVSSYPLSPENSNLPRINDLKNLSKEVGYSDHTFGVEVTKASLEYNIQYIEKHFTTDQSLPGRDNKFAILPEDLKNLSDYIKTRDDSNIYHGEGPLDCELEARSVQTERFNG